MHPDSTKDLGAI